MSQDGRVSTPTGAVLVPHLDDDKRVLLSGGAIIASLGTALTFLVVSALRAGLGDDLGATLVICAYALLPIWLSVWAMNRHGSTPMDAGIIHAASLFIGVLFPLLGLVAGKYIGWLGVALFLAVLAASIHVIRRSVTVIRLKDLLAILLFAALLLIYAGPQRLFLPESMTLGIATSDSYYHAAIAQMILHFGTPSLGADGLILHHYHTLSHAIAAGYAASSGAGVPLVYLYWGGIILKAQLVWCFYSCFILLLPSARLPNFAAAAVGLAYAWLAAILIAGLESESFLLSVILLSAVLPLLAVLMTADDREGHLPAGLTIACLAVLVCAGAKVSAGFFVGIALVVVAWNLRLRWSLLALIAAAFILLALLTKFALTPRDLGMSGTTKMVIIASYMQYLVPETVFSYALPVGVIALLARNSAALVRDQNQPSGGAGWFMATDNLIKFLILATLGCLVVLFTSLIGSNIQYFSAVLYAIALLLLPAALARMPGETAMYNWGPTIVGVLLIAAITPALSKLPADSFTTLVGLYQKAEQPDNHIRIGTDLRTSLHQTHTPFALLRQRIAATPWARFLDVVEKENGRAGGTLAVQIQPDANDVWQRLEGGSAWWCMAPHLMVPSQAGLVEIRSVPPKRIEDICSPPGMVWYGFGGEQDAHRAVSLTDSQVCALARPAGIHEVYRLQSYRDLSKNSITRCG
jgi:hypothetical protein